jgi:hypothetical protein
MVLGLVLLFPAGALAQDTDSSVRPPAPEATAPVVLPAAEKPKPVEKLKPVEKPKPAEKPRALTENTNPAETAPPKPAAKPVETPAPAAPATTDPGVASAGYSFGCLALSFAMLIIGIAAGFVWRHLMSRRKLGGMTVRIGTWRGIP